MSFAITFQNLAGAFLVGLTFGAGWSIASILIGRILK